MIDWQQRVEQRDINGIIEQIPYAQTIGMSAILSDDKIIYLLKSQPENIGNPTLPALHGGCIGGFMETAAIIQCLCELKLEKIPKVVNFSIDYLRAGREQDTYASSHIIREGKRLVNIAIIAWQKDKAEPIASARAHFLLRR